MEKLLNALIEKGWKPFNTEEEKIYIAYRPEEKMLLISNDGIHGYPISLRDLISIECWLWQFVCENGMINNVWNFIFRRLRDGKKFWLDKPITHFTYRIIESALCDEDKLEDFILDNVKINE